MKIAILGSGLVGTTLGTKLAQLGHEVRMGARSATNEKATAWVKQAGKNASQGTFSDAAAFGEIAFNCTSGGASLQALEQADARNLTGKVLVDVANPLDFSKGMPPTLSIVNTDSLGERIQKAFPGARVVKALNTLNAGLMVTPGALKQETDLLICGNDKSAKAQVTEILKSFGWKSIIDLGDITNARATEQLLPLWIRLFVMFGTPAFNFKVVRS
ncbi:MAG: NADPH-dependent F420 reductase [Myxococcales bacterium]